MADEKSGETIGILGYALFPDIPCHFGVLILGELAG
jgi:hypothetical protein